jgi:hypothetical protein
MVDEKIQRAVHAEFQLLTGSLVETKRAQHAWIEAIKAKKGVEEAQQRVLDVGQGLDTVYQRLGSKLQDQGLRGAALQAAGAELMDLANAEAYNMVAPELGLPAEMPTQAQMQEGRKSWADGMKATQDNSARDNRVPSR